MATSIAGYVSAWCGTRPVSASEEIAPMAYWSAEVETSAALRACSGASVAPGC
ncbi:MAG: hypothetical protein U0325_31830 [Polyangiales bacterium]